MSVTALGHRHRRPHSPAGGRRSIWWRGHSHGTTRRATMPDMADDFIRFLGVSVVVIVTPGQDTALTIRNTLLGHRGCGICHRARRRDGAGGLGARHGCGDRGPACGLRAGLCRPQARRRRVPGDPGRQGAVWCASPGWTPTSVDRGRSARRVTPPCLLCADTHLAHGLRHRGRQGRRRPPPAAGSPCPGWPDGRRPAGAGGTGGNRAPLGGSCEVLPRAPPSCGHHSYVLAWVE